MSTSFAQHGSHKIQQELKTKATIDLGPEFEFGEVVYECEVRGADGDLQ